MYFRTQQKGENIKKLFNYIIFALKSCTVYLLRGALCILIFVIFKVALFHFTVV